MKIVLYTCVIIDFLQRAFFGKHGTAIKFTALLSPFSCTIPVCLKVHSQPRRKLNINFASLNYKFRPFYTRGISILIISWKQHGLSTDTAVELLYLWAFTLDWPREYLVSFF